jgi:hypothetical protein
MLFRGIIAVCSEIHTKHINILCGQNVEFVNIELAVHIMTTGLCRGPVTSTPFCWQSVWSLFMVIDLCPVRVSIPASFPSSGYRSSKWPERVAGSLRCNSTPTLRHGTSDRICSDTLYTTTTPPTLSQFLKGFKSPGVTTPYMCQAGLLEY